MQHGFRRPGAFVVATMAGRCPKPEAAQRPILGRAQRGRVPNALQCEAECPTDGSPAEQEIK